MGDLTLTLKVHVHNATTYRLLLKREEKLLNVTILKNNNNNK